MKRVFAGILSLVLLLTMLTAQTVFAGEDTDIEHKTSWFGVHCIVYGDGYKGSYFDAGENPDDNLVIQWTFADQGLIMNTPEISYKAFMKKVDKSFVTHSDLKKRLKNATMAKDGYKYRNGTIYFEARDGGGDNVNLYVLKDNTTKGTGTVLCQWKKQNENGTVRKLDKALLTYKNYAIVSFTKIPKAPSITKLTAGKKAFTVKYSKISKNNTGYQIQYSKSKTFKSAKSVRVTSYKTLSKKVTKLKAGKKYYVRVRGYKKLNGKRYYTAWSKVRSITVK